MKITFPSRHVLIGLAGFFAIIFCTASGAVEKNMISIRVGAAMPSNGSGWITRHLENGWCAGLEYSRVLQEKWSFYVDASAADHSVDTSDTTEEDSDVSSFVYGAGAGLRYSLLTKEKFMALAGAGVGIYASELRSDSSVEDSASAFGLDVNLVLIRNLRKNIYLSGRADYMKFFSEEGASFDDITITGGLGLRF